jgi:hypothetical protein
VGVDAAAMASTGHDGVPERDFEWWWLIRGGGVYSMGSTVAKDVR